MRAPFIVVLTALVATLVGAPARTTAAEPEPAPEPLRIMLLGDSVTQGSSGDWTWRYRLWQHLTRAGVAVDLVGYRDDVQKLGVQGATSQVYADPHFDRDHAARWGMWAAFPDVPVATLMAEHRPDVVVVMLGVNDLLWSDDPASAVVARVGALVSQMRQGNPDVTVVLAAASQSWFRGVPEFNAGLAVLAADVSTGSSPVVFADVAAGYQQGANTWDGSHPNARGEVRIAAGVADALAEVGIGRPAARPLDLPAVGPLDAATLSVAGGNGRATLAWVGPEGATGQRLWSRDRSRGTPWSVVASGLPRDGSRELVLTNGHRYEFRLQAVKGDDVPTTGVHSTVVSVVPSRYPTLGAPRQLRATAGRRCARLTWRAVAHVRRYEVRRWNGRSWVLVARPTRTALVLRGLPARRAWTFKVRAVAGAQTGPSRTVRVVRRPGRC